MDGHRANCKITFPSQCRCIFPVDRGASHPTGGTHMMHGLPLGSPNSPFRAWVSSNQRKITDESCLRGCSWSWGPWGWGSPLLSSKPGCCVRHLWHLLEGSPQADSFNFFGFLCILHACCGRESISGYCQGKRSWGEPRRGDGGVTHRGGWGAGDSSRAWKAGAVGHGMGSGEDECGFKPQQG